MRTVRQVALEELVRLTEEIEKYWIQETPQSKTQGKFDFGATRNLTSKAASYLRLLEAYKMARQAYEKFRYTEAIRYATGDLENVDVARAEEVPA